MGLMIQFPSPALWHQLLSGPPVSRDQGTRNPVGGFNEMVHAQLANQNAIAGLHPPPPRIQREKDARDKAPLDKDRSPRGRPQRRDDRQDSGAAPDSGADGPPPPRVRALWA